MLNDYELKDALIEKLMDGYDQIVDLAHKTYEDVKDVLPEDNKNIKKLLRYVPNSKGIVKAFNSHEDNLPKSSSLTVHLGYRDAHHEQSIIDYPIEKEAFIKLYKDLRSDYIKAKQKKMVTKGFLNWLFNGSLGTPFAALIVVPIILLIAWLIEVKTGISLKGFTDRF